MSKNALQADEAVIRNHLKHITRRWSELDIKCVLEVRILTSEDRAEVKNVARYAPDETGIDLASDHIAAMNVHKLNAYVVVNPIRADAQIKAGQAAKDEHIAGSFFHWADADDSQAAENIRSFVGPRPTFYVLTGTQPSPRPHVYWELEEPTLNMTAWNATQKAIAETLKTDSSVVNPSRIMRVAGTVNWPKPQKVAKGYTQEITALHVHTEDDRPLVASERMARAFIPKETPANDFHIATGDHDRKSADAYADILRRARTDGEKHTGVRDLSASLAGAGVPRAMAEAMIREACPVWDEGVEGLINSAYQKFYNPDIPSFEPPASSDKIETWPTLLTEFNEMALPRREWVYGNSYIRKYVSVVAAAGGIGKTSLGNVEGLCICTGKPLLGETVKEQAKVWIINLEDPRSEMLMRTLAAMKHYGLTEKDVKGQLFLDGEDDIQITLAAESRDGVIKNDALLEYMRAKIIAEGIGVVIVDPFVSTHMVNENSNAAIQSVVSMFRELARDTGAAVMLVHHTRKGNGEDANIDSVRGAGSLIGAARSARVINKVTKEDAEKLGVSHKEATGIFRVDDGKANLSPPADEALYRRMIGVQIENGEWVGVATPFELPDEWAGMSEEVINDMLRQINKGPARDNEDEEYFSLRPQDKARWVGKVITDYPFKRAEDLKNDGQAKAIIRQWFKSGLLEEIEYFSAAQRKDRKGVAATGRVGGQT